MLNLKLQLQVHSQRSNIKVKGRTSKLMLWACVWFSLKPLYQDFWYNLLSMLSQCVRNVARRLFSQIDLGSFQVFAGTIRGLAKRPVHTEIFEACKDFKVLKRRSLDTRYTV